MKQLITILLSLLIINQAYSQNGIIGRIIEDDNISVEFANIVIETKDSVFIRGTISDEDGRFNFREIPQGDYLLHISFLGYMPQRIAINTLSRDIDFGNILLEKESNILNEITVTASNSTNKVDRMIVFITDQQKTHSNDGVNLLSTLNLPQLIINPMLGTISLPNNEKIQLCINGVKVDETNIKAINPKEVIRVEYINNPGVRYNNASVVINYITRRETTGGAIGINTMNATTCLFGNEQATLKLNHKKSEFGFIYSGRLRNMNKVFMNKTTSFNFADRAKLIRYDEGIPQRIKENSHLFNLNYSYLDLKKYFYASFSYDINDSDKKALTNQHSSLDFEKTTKVHQGGKQKQYLPSLDLYYSQFFKNEQTLIINLVGTYIDSDINQLYDEKLNNKPITEIISNVSGKKYSLIGEAIYEKIFDNKNRITTGIKHTQAYANNKYTGTVNNSSKMSQSDSYAFIQYTSKTNKISYMGGLGISRLWNKQKGDKSRTDYIFRPQLSAQYNFKPQLYIRMKAEISSTNPSLANMSDVAQYIDTLRVTKGNPNLKSNINYQTELSLSWDKDIFSVNWNTYYRLSPNAIMEDIYTENNIFVTTYNNQINWKKLNSELTFSLNPLKNLLTISITGGINRYWSKGNNYTHNLTNYYYRTSVMLMYKNMTASFSARNAYDNLWGETMTGGEVSQDIFVSYNQPKFSIGLGVLNIISNKYERKSENLNEYNPSVSYSYINNLSKMVMINFSWNLNFGKKGNSKSKRLDNLDKETGIISNK